MNRILTGGQPSLKKIAGLFLITLAAVISAAGTIYGMRIPSSTASCALAAFLYVVLYTRTLSETTKYEKICILVFSALLSASAVQGALLRIEGETYTGLVKENYMGYFHQKDAASMVVMTLSMDYLNRWSLPMLNRLGVFLHLERPGSFQESRRVKSGKERENRKSEKKVKEEYGRKNALFSKKWKTRFLSKVKDFFFRHRSFLLPAVFLFVCWLPYFISYYPGFILGDSCSSIRQAMGLEHYSNHYPVMYTLFIRLCLSIGEFFGSLTFGCAVYSLIQMLFLSCALAGSIQWLRRRGLSWQLCMLLTVYFGITPFFGQVSIAMWKDPVFSASILLWTLLLFDHIYPRESVRKRKEMKNSGSDRIDWLFLLKNTGLLLLICFSRNNGIYIALFCAAAFLLVWILNARKRSYFHGIKEAAAGGIAVIIICCAVTGPVYEAAGVKPAERVERVGVMMNQMARTVALSGKMSDEDRKFMNRLLPIKKYKKAYRPCVIDLLKWDEDFDTEYLNEHMDDFYQTWLSMGLKNPRSYFQAWELLTFGYWMPNQWGLFYDGANILKGNLNDLQFDEDLHDQIDLAYGGKNLDTGLRAVFDCKGNIMGLGFVSWILLFALMITVLRREWAAFAALMPSVCLFLTLLLASPYYYWQRYGLAEYYLLPVYLYIIFCYSGASRKNREHHIAGKRYGTAGNS